MLNEITKLALNQTVAQVVANRTRDFLIDHTEIDPDSTLLKVGSSCVGAGVSMSVKPYVNDAVDRASAWITSKRNKQTVTSK